MKLVQEESSGFGEALKRFSECIMGTSLQEGLLLGLFELKGVLLEMMVDVGSFSIQLALFHCLNSRGAFKKKG